MQIQMQQRDIEAALRSHLAQQGIAVAGKNVSIAFTVKRKQGGVTAYVTIEDGEDIPGFTDVEPEVQPRIDTILRAVPVTAEAPTEAPAEVTVVEEPVVLAEAEPEPEVVTEAPKPKTTSLFS